MAAWVIREEEKALETGRGREERKRRTRLSLHLAGVTVVVGSLRRFRAALIGPTQGLPKRRRLCQEDTLKTLRIIHTYGVCCRCFAFGCKCH